MQGLSNIVPPQDPDQPSMARLAAANSLVSGSVATAAAGLPLQPTGQYSPPAVCHFHPKLPYDTLVLSLQVSLHCLLATCT